MKVFQYLEIFGFKALQSSVKSSGFPGNTLFLFSEILGLGLYSLEILLKENKREEKTKHLWQLHQQMIKSKIWIKQRESILSFRPYKAEAKRGLVKVAKHLVHPRQNLMRWVGDVQILSICQIATGGASQCGSWQTHFDPVFMQRLLQCLVLKKTFGHLFGTLLWFKI